MTITSAQRRAVRVGGRQGRTLIQHGIQAVCPILGARAALLALVALVAADGALHVVKAGTRSAMSQARGRQPGRVALQRFGMRGRQDLL